MQKYADNPIDFDLDKIDWSNPDEADEMLIAMAVFPKDRDGIKIP
jgi:hypothetical protein